MDDFRREIYQAIEKKFKLLNEESLIVAKHIEEQIELKLMENERLDKKQGKLLVFLLFSNIISLLLLFGHLSGAI